MVADRQMLLRKHKSWDTDHISIVSSEGTVACIPSTLDDPPHGGWVLPPASKLCQQLAAETTAQPMQHCLPASQTRHQERQSARDAYCTCCSWPRSYVLAPDMVTAVQDSAGLYCRMSCVWDKMSTATYTKRCGAVACKLMFQAGTGVCLLLWCLQDPSWVAETQGQEYLLRLLHLSPSVLHCMLEHAMAIDSDILTPYQARRHALAPTAP